MNFNTTSSKGYICGFNELRFPPPSWSRAQRVRLPTFGLNRLAYLPVRKTSSTATAATAPTVKVQEDEEPDPENESQTDCPVHAYNEWDTLEVKCDCTYLCEVKCDCTCM